jgi:hypothetical protein
MTTREVPMNIYPHGISQIAVRKIARENTIRNRLSFFLAFFKAYIPATIQEK